MSKDRRIEFLTKLKELFEEYSVEIYAETEGEGYDTSDPWLDIVHLEPGQRTSLEVSWYKSGGVTVYDLENILKDCS